MITRLTVRRIHRLAAWIAFATILAFWSATLASELAGDHAAVAMVKRAILWGMLVLVPAIAAAGATGSYLGGGSRAPLVGAKKRRMPFIALNGVLVLVPAAVFLAARAAAGSFDASFYAVQAIELAAGTVNLALIGRNLRDGLRLTGRSPLRSLVRARSP